MLVRLTCIYDAMCTTRQKKVLLVHREFSSYLHFEMIEKRFPCVQSDAIWEKVGKDQQESDEKQGRNHETNKELLYLINQSRNPFKAPWFDRRQLCRDFVNWTGRMRPILSRIRIWTLSFVLRVPAVYLTYTLSVLGQSRLITTRSV